MDLRDYVYNRTRWGATGSVDYKLSEGSNISLRGLFSTFRNWGNKWVFTMNDGGNPQYSQDWRRPNMAIGSLALEGKHIFNANTISLERFCRAFTLAERQRRRQLSMDGRPECTVRRT